MKKLQPIYRTIGLFLAVKAIFTIALFEIAPLREIRFSYIFRRWDAQWYRRIAEGGYGHIVVAADGRHLSDFAFFPLYPLTERILHNITHLTYIASGVFITFTASIFAVIAIHKIVSQLFSEQIALITVVMWAALPISFVTSIAYSESLFTALAAWSLWHCLRKDWLSAGFLAALAGLTRPTGLAVAVAVVIAATFELKVNRDNLRAWGALIVAPLGWLGYMAYVSISVGHWNGYSTVTRDWGNTIDGGQTFIKWIWSFFASGSSIKGFLILVALLILVLQVYQLWKLKLQFEIFLFTLLIVILALITSGFFGSKPRYLLPVFPLLLPTAVGISNWKHKYIFYFLSAFTLLSAILSAFWLTGSGPL